MNLILHITDIAFGGNGVARLDGKVFFVPFTAPGDVVRARIIRDKKKFAETQLLEILTPSPHRVAPPCAYFGKCGGCSYQHIAYAQQLEIKHRQVEQTLRRVGKFDSVPMRPIVPSPAPYHFRNRIRVHIENGVAGFYAHGSHALVPITHCEIAQPAVNEALHGIRQRPLHDGDYTLTGGTTGTYFSQTNDLVAAELLALVQREAKADHTHLIDAYCGAGFFAHALAPNYPQVTGIEENEHATTHARRVALENETYLTGDVVNHLGTALAGHDLSRTTLLLDPPALGLAPGVIGTILNALPADILYISCNPSTMARDLALLAPHYTLESVTPLDMFPQTAEIEALAVLRQKTTS